MFHQTMKTIAEHNAKPSATWKMGVNHLTDLTPAEFKKMRGYKPAESIAARKMGNVKRHVKSGMKLPASVDYRKSVPAILTAVKDQGMCGSCWAHATTEGIESYWAIKTGNLFTLSQQQITSCTPNPQECGGSGGCNGATAQVGMEYIKSVGLTQEWNYPYTSYFGDSGVCNTQAIKPVVNITGYVNVDSNDYDSLMDAVATQGPIDISVDASAWNTYESGVYSGCSLNATIDHAVQLVGYGHDNTLNVDYWIVRNSWSPNFGESGYIRVLRSSNVQCGYDNDPSQGDACKNPPATQYVCGECGILFDNCYPTV
jgi:cathepsin L